MTTMRLPFYLSPLDSDVTAVEILPGGGITLTGGVVFGSVATFVRPNNFISLATSLTTVQASAWAGAVYTGAPDSDDGIFPAQIGFLAVTVNSSTMYIPVYSGSARFGLG